MSLSQLSCSSDVTEFSGWLMKKEKYNNAWNKVYCVLNSRTLKVYPNNETKEASETVLLSPETQIDVSEFDQTDNHVSETLPEFNENENKNINFSISTSDPNVEKVEPEIELTSETPENTQHWITAIQGALTVSPTLSMDDFKIISVVGRGSYGKVMLVQKKSNEHYYALKSIRKKTLIDEDKCYTVIAERNILMKMRHPFIIGLHFAFQTKTKFYLGLDYAPGGELYNHLDEVGTFPVDQVKIYIAEIALALDYMHSIGIVYRDLKPENVMLDSKGHVRLTDFGLSKDLSLTGDNSTSTFCGTPDYLAPEIVQNHNYGFQVDWWALAILAYEMLTATTPFFHKSRNRLLENIVNTPPRMSLVKDKNAADWIRFMLVKDPKNRPGFEELKDHPFFNDLNWDDVLEKKYEPDFKPLDSGRKSLSNFNTEYTTELAADSYTNSDEEFGMFEDFHFYDSFRIPDY
ncbi:Serine/threonine-protein kinase Sgk1 [Tritrichomonas foetus]|uniref:Serine/threonine-protein kinase Sgk1 n=1 Tax=Tritrichomonas foetus TaxID=1144522 RepID=A0A1J4KV33_9EUKA|nr:Serine/threonine-protein kinase Sgk1 [Tritrichomonas foetus]|eukprot:OHT15177.1 Serine/threonine-protein kinase Sgk1 [Tritrichomonas foetus]